MFLEGGRGGNQRVTDDTHILFIMFVSSQSQRFVPHVFYYGYL